VKLGFFRTQYERMHKKTFQKAVEQGKSVVVMKNDDSESIEVAIETAAKFGYELASQSSGSYGFMGFSRSQAMLIFKKTERDNEK